MATLYREYRPQLFSEVLGQNHIKITLENEISSNKIAHAYLFCGPRAVGKTTLARIFAKSVNCLNRKEDEYEPCDNCDNCNNTREGKNLETIEIDAASNTGVDNVRESIIASTHIAPSGNKYKVFIIDEVHMLSISAFNALLKTMEEPPSYIIFILCTTEVHKVPSTIISRCQRFDFKRISVSDIVKKLEYITKKEKISVEKSVLESIARKSDGYMRDAESLLTQIISISGKDITKEEADLIIPYNDIEEILNFIEFLSKKDTSNAIQLINNVINNGIDLNNFLLDLTEVLRKMMLNKINVGLAEKLGLDFGETAEIRINKMIEEIDLRRLTNIIEKIVEVQRDTKHSHIIQLPAELAITELCLASNYKTVVKKSDIEEIEQEKVGVTDNSLNQMKPSREILHKEAIKSKWKDFLNKIKEYNPSLSFILQTCEPRKMTKDVLEIAFKYKIHRDRINNTEVKLLIEKVLTEIYSSSIKIEAIIDENLVINIPATKSSEKDSSEIKKEEVKKEEKKPEIMNNLLQTLGGELIN